MISPTAKRTPLSRSDDVKEVAADVFGRLAFAVIVDAGDGREAVWKQPVLKMPRRLKLCYGVLGIGNMRGYRGDHAFVLKQVPDILGVVRHESTIGFGIKLNERVL